MTIATTYATLPVRGLARLEAPPEERAAFLDELRRTAYDLGFFYVTGHSVDPALMRDVAQRHHADLRTSEAFAAVVASPA
jgi:isopenicillin N synthase-like dioxygenase